MKKTIEINLFSIIIIPCYVLAFLATWKTPIFWVILILGIKDMKATITFERYRTSTMSKKSRKKWSGFLWAKKSWLDDFKGVK